MKTRSGRPLASVMACSLVFSPPFVRPIGRPRWSSPPSGRELEPRRPVGLKEINGSFSIRRVWVKHLRAISITLVFDVDRGLSLLFGIGTAALPSWDQKSGAVQSDSRPDSGLAVDPGPIANSPHPSSREGHRSTSGGSLLRSDLDQISAAPSRDQRNSLPSIHILCMMTAMRRAKATTAFFKPPRLATVMAQAFSHDHFFTRVSMDCAAS